MNTDLQLGDHLSGCVVCVDLQRQQHGVGQPARGLRHAPPQRAAVHSEQTQVGLRGKAAEDVRLRISGRWGFGVVIRV